MKFGCCLNMLASVPGGTGIEKMNYLAASGYDYAELPLSETVSLSKTDFSKLCNSISETGISCECCNNFFPSNVRLTGPDVSFPLVTAYCEHALDIAATLGAKIVVFGSGGAKNIPKGFDHNSAYDQIVRLLQFTGELASSRGITICIEPLRKIECNLINTFEEGCKLSADVGSENVKVLVDLYHMSSESESSSVLLKHGAEFLRHVHVGTPETRGFPTLAIPKAEQSIDFFNALKAIGYNNRVSVEAYSDNFISDAISALDFLKSSLCAR